MMFPRWHSRGYLPHYDNLNKIQAVTFRLADSLSQRHLDRLALELAVIPAQQWDVARRKWIEQWLDAGMGCCALRHPSLAEVVQETLLKFDAQRYRLLAWCIMPNHVHVLLQPGESLSRILQSWKSYTGRWALAHNHELDLRIPGKSLWMREAWDRFIRDASHLRNVEKYIRENPVKAGLCRRPEDWPWSSASHDVSPGTAEPQLGTAQVGTTQAAKHEDDVFPGTAEPQLGSAQVGTTQAAKHEGILRPSQCLSGAGAELGLGGPRHVSAQGGEP